MNTERSFAFRQWKNTCIPERIRDSLSFYIPIYVFTCMYVGVHVAYTTHLAHITAPVPCLLDFPGDLALGSKRQQLFYYQQHIFSMKRSIKLQIVLFSNFSHKPGLFVHHHPIDFHRIILIISQRFYQ